MSTTLARAPEVEPVHVAAAPRSLDAGLISRLGRGPLPEVELVGAAVPAPAGARPRRRSPLGRPFARHGAGPPSPPRPAGRGPLAPRPPRPLPPPRGLAPPTSAPGRPASSRERAAPAPVLPELAPWLSARPAPALVAVPAAAPPPPALPVPASRASAGAPRRRRLLPVALVVGAVAASAALAAAAGVLPSVFGGGASAEDGTPPLATPLAPTADAVAEIPPRYLSLYRSIGARMDIDWRFLAAIGGQESDHGRNPAAGRVNHAGCVGPMQIGVGGDCGDFLSAWGTDGDGDGRVDPRDPADAIATAAHGLREGKGAPPPGGAWIAYYRAACGYYGACADARADYAADVMARAGRYGLPARR